ncbi:hypothetical protein Hdeb2414_s0015g00446761 [Helianthus debilis subsp. tardiflorus]
MYQPQYQQMINNNGFKLMSISYEKIIQNHIEKIIQNHICFHCSIFYDRKS